MNEGAPISKKPRFDLFNMRRYKEKEKECWGDAKGLLILIFLIFIDIN